MFSYHTHDMKDHHSVKTTQLKCRHHEMCKQITSEIEILTVKHKMFSQYNSATSSTHTDNACSSTFSSAHNITTAVAPSVVPMNESAMVPSVAPIQICTYSSNEQWRNQSRVFFISDRSATSRTLDILH